MKYAIKGMAAYLYNTSTYDVVIGVFPDAHSSYIQEKLDRITERGIHTFLGYLDQEHFDKFVSNVEEYINKTNIV